jgi:hypothetical protein
MDENVFQEMAERWMLAAAKRMPEIAGVVFLG